LVTDSRGVYERFEQNADAIEGEKRGLLYSMRIRLKQNHVRAGARDIPLTPGMTV